MGFSAHGEFSEAWGVESRAYVSSLVVLMAPPSSEALSSKMSVSSPRANATLEVPQGEVGSSSAALLCTPLPLSTITERTLWYGVVWCYRML